MSRFATAWLFPGHGSQYVGMGRDILLVSGAARQVFDEVESLAGLPVRDVMLRGPEAMLSRPALLEPALAALAISHAEWLREHGLAPDWVAGYSAGEVAALHVAGVVTRTDALRLAVLRGRILEGAAAGPSVRMAAIYGLPAHEVEEIVRALQASGEIAIAGWNTADHTTVVGAVATVLEVERVARDQGGVASAVPVAGAWHSAAVAPAADRAWRASREIEFRRPNLPLMMGMLGRAEGDPNRIRLLLARQISTPVRWRQVMDGLLQGGCSRFIELGPGGLLSALARRRLPDTAAFRIRCCERRGGVLVRPASLKAERAALRVRATRPEPVLISS